MSCSCLKNDLNFYIDYTNCRTLLLEDQSIWMEGDGFKDGEKLNVSIMALSLGKSFDIVLDVGKRNAYDSEDVIGIEDVCIPDDIFCFTVENCGKVYSINRAYLCNTFCKIEQLKAKAKTQEERNQYRELETIADQIIVNSEFGKANAASELLHLLNKKLKHVKCGSC